MWSTGKNLLVWHMIIINLNTETVGPFKRRTQRRFPPKYIENSFQAIQSTFRSLKMYSKRRHKICVCSVIQEELESFRN